ncbi:Vacuolar protein sorting-associated protein 51 [Araneus ventricosus]|uniref:Vacuolar protein sorting-associated protein 51 homolog n=1 Tax=Araneus ventricosus TaxID=182803 RepID=A0A4Y2JF41_ARAVE|nr:Vacuolar protein sorting-associated protein 51 [Araneus ventricosus]
MTLLQTIDELCPNTFYNPICTSGYLTPLQRKKLREKRNLSLSPNVTKGSENLNKPKSVSKGIKKAKTKRTPKLKSKEKVIKKVLKQKESRDCFPQLQCSISDLVGHNKDDNLKEKKFFKNRSPQHLKKARFVMPLTCKKGLDFIPTMPLRPAKDDIKQRSLNNSIMETSTESMELDDSFESCAGESQSNSFSEKVSSNSNTEVREISDATSSDSSSSSQVSENLENTDCNKKSEKKGICDKFDLFEFDWPSDEVLLERENRARAVLRESLAASKSNSSFGDFNESSTNIEETSPPKKLFPIFNKSRQTEKEQTYKQYNVYKNHLDLEHFIRILRASPKQLAECVDLLLQLEEPTEVLCDEFLKHAKEKLDDDLKELESHLNYPEESVADKTDEASKKQMDILEFIDFSYNNFVSNTSLVIASYWDLFLQKPAADSEHKKTVDMNIPMKKLEDFVIKLMEQYFTFIEIRFSKENSSNDDAILVRALDRFYRRVQAMNRLLPHIDFTLRGIKIVQKAAQDRCNYYLQKLIECFSAALVNMRQNIVAPRSLNQDGTKALTDLLNTFESQISSRINTVQADLQLFIQTDITFAMKVQFKEEFCRQYVREGVIIAFLRHINKTCQEFCSCTERNTVPPQLILVLSRFCLNLEQSAISEWVSLVDDSFSITNDNGLTSISDICMETKEVAQKLIDHFVKVQGLNISQVS